MEDVRTLIFSPDDTELILGTKSGVIRSYSRSRQQLTEREFDLGDELFTLRYLNEGRQLVLVGATKLAILDASNWQVIQEVPLPKMSFCSAAINSTGTRLVRGEYGETRGNGDIEFVDLRSGEVVRRQRAFDGNLAPSCVFLADDRHVVIVNGSARPVTIWDSDTQTQIRHLRGHLLAGHGGSLSREGERLVTTSSFPESVKIWDTRMEGMREVLNLSAPGGIFQAAGFSPDGSVVYAIERQGTAYFWRAPAWDEISNAEKQARTGSHQPEP